MTHQENIEKRYKELVKKYSEGQCSPEEALEVVNWLMEPKLKSSLSGALLDIWQKNLDPEVHLDQTDMLHSTLDKIHQGINKEKEHEVYHMQKRIRLYHMLLRVAAVLFLPFLAISILYIKEKFEVFPDEVAYTEVSVSQGARSNTVLPDGTVVWLNSGSVLRYPQSFSRKNRSATLSGEAYFEVVSDPSKPFFVRTESLDIRVTGTKFNVMAYPGDDFLSATLEEGKIAIERSDAKGKSSQLCSLEPNERIVFQKEERTIGKSTVNTDQFTSWKEGKLIFRNNTFEYIIGKLERWYNADIEITGDDTFLQSPFTMTIENETIELVLEYLSIASGISYEVVPLQILENGEISTKKYIVRNNK